MAAHGRSLRRRELLQAAGAGAAGLYVAGCGGSSSKLPGTSTTTSAKVSGGVPGPPAGGGTRGGQLVVAWQTEPDSLDPAIGYNLAAWDAQCCVTQAPLLVFGANASNPVPNAAAAMPQVSSSGTEYTIRLRPGVRFHTGRAITADDYVWTWERLLDPHTGSWAASYLFSIEGAAAVNAGKAKRLAGVQAVDDRTLRVRLTARDSTFLNLLAEPYTAALPRDEVQRYGKDFGRHVVGAGPFALASYDSRGQTATFRRNPHYLWKGLPYLDSIEYRWGIDPQLQLLQLESGKIDSIGPGIGASLVARVNAQPQLKKYVHPIALQAVRWISLNTHRPPLNDVRVRQALNYAINRQQLVRVAYGESVAWGAPFPKNLPDYRRTATPYGYDPERARALLSQAGAKNVAFTLLIDDEDPWPQEAQIVQQQLQAVGVHMTIRTVSASALTSLTQHGDDDAFGTDWYMVQPTALDIITTNYVTHGSSNYNKYSSAEVDRLTAQATKAQDPHASNDIIASIEDRITRDAPGIFLSSLNFILGYSPDLHNYQYNAIYGTYYDRLWKA